MTGRTRTVAPAAEPVSLAQLKEWAVVDSTFSDDDDLLNRCITSAREYVEEATHRALITQTWEVYLDQFPASDLASIELPLPPLQSITSITYIDDDGVEQTWDSANYRVLTGNADGVGRIVPIYDGEYPDTRDQDQAVTITAVVGYGDAGTDVPTNLRSAISYLAHNLYTYREGVVANVNLAELPYGIRSIINQYRVPILA